MLFKPQISASTLFLKDWLLKPQVFISNVWTAQHTLSAPPWRTALSFKFWSLKGTSGLAQPLPTWLRGKESTCNGGDMGSIPGSRRTPEKKMTTRASILAWEISWTEEPGRLQSVPIHFSRVRLLGRYGLWSTRLFCLWDSPGKNTGVHCHVLLQGNFLTQESNLYFLRLLHCRWILYWWPTREAQIVTNS